MGSPTGRGRAALASFAVAVVAVLGWEAAAGRAGFTVNSTADMVDARAGDGACATQVGLCTLRAAIQEANALPGADSVELPAGTYALAIPPLNQNDVTTGDLDITDSLTITGAGAGATIVDAGVPPAGAPPQVPGLDRIFEVAAGVGSAAFDGLTLSDGFAAEYGGAIANNSAATITVRASELTGNVAGKAGGAIDNHLGGAVDVRDSTVSGNFAFESGSALNNNRAGTLTVVNSAVSSNSGAAVGLDEALVGAGAISNNAELDTSGTITVIGSEISGNRAGGGRAGATISNDGTGSVTVERTTFSDNVATGDGGAIFNGSGEVSVSDSVFSENGARDGGAIYNSAKEGRMTVRGSRFSLNSASGRGGAIVTSGTGALTVSESTFSGNSAGDLGGAVLNDDKGSVTIADSAFQDNAGLSGGAFANEGTGLVRIEDSTFTGNSAVAGLVLAGGEGGGLHSDSVGDVVISGGAFSGNEARSGGGLSNEGGGTLAITGTRFSANRADEQGGGLLIQSGAVRMVGIDVVGNVSESPLEGGGGIAYAGDKLVAVGESAAIAGSRIRDNETAGEGGGIDSRGDGPLAITTTAVTGNKAASGGGIHHVGDAPLDVTRSTLSGNSAGDGGGVFSDGDGEAAIENSTVSGNGADEFGGGLLVSSRVTLRSSTVANNSAKSGGGINNGGSDLVGDGSVFLANTIVANSPTGGNCAGTMTSLGGNVENADSCRLRELSDQPGTDPRLGALADNGGPTQTHALLSGSPAQGAAICAELDSCPGVDQRGVARPQFDGSDAGAYESESSPGGGGGQPCAGVSERPLRSDSDSWVSQSAAASNFGGDATLKVESKPAANDRALVDFTLPAVPPGCKLVAATLRLHSSSATDGHALQALRIASAWSEGGVTWGNQPAVAGPAATTQSGVGPVEWDVLAQALDMYAHGSHGFLIRDADEGGSGEQSFHSREKGEDAPPELVLVFDDPDAPPQPSACPTTPQSISADQDSWLSEGSPSNNFGNDSTLKVKSQTANNSRAVVRFPLPALPAGCTGVASATLRIEAASAKEGRTLEALQVASAWAETGVTWSNRPGTTGAAATVPSAEGPLEWSVTAQILDMYTSANHGFLIRDAVENGVGDEQTLNSRDKLNDGPPELVVVFDDSTPETTIDSGPDSPTEDTDAEFSFSSDRSDATFECSLDGATFSACTSPHRVSVSWGREHSFQVRAKRKVRAVDPTPARYEWTVGATVPDTSTPDTTLTGQPPNPSAGGPASFSFSGSDDRTPQSLIAFQCRLDSQAPTAFAPCSSPATYTGLPDGSHTFEVRAADAAGNADPTPARWTWRIDTQAPQTTIDTGPAAVSADATPTFQFSSEAGASFHCRADTGAFAACSSPHTTAALADGTHTFEVRATDMAGNTGAAAGHILTIDTQAPTATIVTKPADPSNDQTPTFEFSSEAGARFECRADTGAFAACPSPHTTAALADGTHTFEVRASDLAGNTGAPAHWTWRIDMQAPQTTINSRPDGVSADATPSFAFTAEPDGRLECRLDNGGWEPCTSPLTLGPLPDGEHSFEVRATDLAGNSGVPAGQTWTIDTQAPDNTAPTTTTASGPAGQADSARGDPLDARTPAPPRIEVTVAYSAKARKAATTFRSLAVKGVPAGGGVRTTCKGGSCPRKSLTIASAAGGTVKLRPFQHTALRVGTTLRIRVTKDGMIGAVKVLRIRARRSPAVSTLCAPPGLSKPTAC